MVIQKYKRKFEIVSGGIGGVEYQGMQPAHNIPWVRVDNGNWVRVNSDEFRSEAQFRLFVNSIATEQQAEELARRIQGWRYTDTGGWDDNWQPQSECEPSGD